MSYGKLIAVIVLVFLSPLTSCSTARINCREAETYRKLWLEAEKEADECVSHCDRLQNP